MTDHVKPRRIFSQAAPEAFEHQGAKFHQMPSKNSKDECNQSIAEPTLSSPIKSPFDLKKLNSQPENPYSDLPQQTTLKFTDRRVNQGYGHPPASQVEAAIRLTQLQSKINQAQISNTMNNQDLSSYQPRNFRTQMNHFPQNLGMTNSSGASSSVVKFAPKHSEEIEEYGATPLILKVHEQGSLTSISESQCMHVATNEELMSDERDSALKS